MSLSWIAHRTPIIIDDIGERTEGQYNDNDHTVMIDTDVFYGADGYKVINVVSHEIHHMYTYKQIEFFQKCIKIVTNMNTQTCLFSQG